MTTISKSCVRQNTWQIERLCCRQETWRQHEVCQYISFTKREAETATKPTQMLFWYCIVWPGEFKDFQGPVEWNSSTFKHLSCFKVLSRPWIYQKKNSRTFKDVWNPVCNTREILRLGHHRGSFDFQKLGQRASHPPLSLTGLQSPDFQWWFEVNIAPPTFPYFAPKPPFFDKRSWKSMQILNNPISALNTRIAEIFTSLRISESRNTLMTWWRQILNRKWKYGTHNSESGSRDPIWPLLA